MSDRSSYLSEETVYEVEKLVIRIFGYPATERVPVDTRIHPAMTLQEIGQELGLTKQRVAQIEQSALKKVRQNMKRRGIKFEDLF